MIAGREEALIIIILASRDPTLVFGHTVCVYVCVRNFIRRIIAYQIR